MSVSPGLEPNEDTSQKNDSETQEEEVDELEWVFNRIDDQTIQDRISSEDSGEKFKKKIARMLENVNLYTVLLLNHVGGLTDEEKRVLETIRENLSEIEDDYLDILGTSRLLIIRGNRAKKHGEGIQKGLKYYDRALEMDPDNNTALHRKGITLGELGKEEKAMECHEELIERDSDDSATGLIMTGLALLKINAHKKALECFDKALEINDDRALGWYEKGMVLAEMDRNDEAKECFEEFLTFNPLSLTGYSEYKEKVEEWMENHR